MTSMRGLTPTWDATPRTAEEGVTPLFGRGASVRPAAKLPLYHLPHILSSEKLHKLFKIFIPKFVQFFTQNRLTIQKVRRIMSS